MTVKGETEQTMHLKLAVYNLDIAIKELQKAEQQFKAALVNLEAYRNGQKKHNSRN